MFNPAALLLVAAIMLPAGATAADQVPSAPHTILSAGSTHAVPNAAYMPDPARTYQVVFTLTKASAAPDKVNPSLERVARTVNLYTGAGVPLTHLKFVAIASGEATWSVLDNAQYQRKFGVPNPNLAVIAELRQAGIDVAVCGQAVAERELPFEAIDRNVTLALSALTTITELQQDGYGLMAL